MRLKDYKLFFAAAGLIGVLLMATPALGMVLRLPGGEQFSELYVLGPGRMAEDYPFNIAAGQNYSVFIGVGNHVGSSAYYALYVKFRNQAEFLPNATVGAPSPLQPLYEYRFLIRDGESAEAPLTFSVSGVSVSENQCLIERLTINDVGFDVNKPAVWDVNGTGFYYQLFVELWIYNAAFNAFEFNDRFVGLQLNMTGSV